MAADESTAFFHTKRVSKKRIPHIFIDGVEYKHCSGCDQDKLLTEYAMDNARWDKCSLLCKPCKNTKKQKWTAEHALEQKAYFQARYLASRDEVIVRSRTWYAANKDRAAVIQKIYALAHPEKAEWTRQWCATHPQQMRIIKRRGKLRRRVRLAGLPFQWTQADEAFALQYWHYTCAVCGTERGLSLDIALDHWIPVHHPDCPGTVVGNMIPLCHGRGGCNNKKHDKDPIVWLRETFGVRQAKAKTKAIEAFFVQARLFAERELACNVG